MHLGLPRALQLRGLSVPLPGATVAAGNTASCEAHSFWAPRAAVGHRDPESLTPRSGHFLLPAMGSEPQERDRWSVRAAGGSDSPDLFILHVDHPTVSQVSPNPLCCNEQSSETIRPIRWASPTGHTGQTPDAVARGHVHSSRAVLPRGAGVAEMVENCSVQDKCQLPPIFKESLF